MTKKLPESILEKALKNEIPISVHFDLTYLCNLHCIHCYLYGQNKNRSELNTADVKSLLDSLANAGTLYLTLSGGEILLREDFFEIAYYARNNNFALKLLTNGTLLDEETADMIASLNPQSVSISIYSADPLTHDRITGQVGSFQKSLSAVVMLRERDVRVRLSTMVMKQNVDDYRSVYELANKLGTDFRADYRIAPKFDQDLFMYPDELWLDENDLNKILVDPVFLLENKSKDDNTYPTIFNTIPCGSGHISCCISLYGDVYPCVLLPIVCGNIKEEPFIDIWKNSSWMKYVRSITLQKLGCSNCSFQQYCRPCLAFSYFDGNLYRPSERVCLEAKILQKLGKKRR